MNSINREEWRQFELRQLASLYAACEDIALACHDKKLRAAAESRMNRIASQITKLGGTQFLTEVHSARAIARVQGLSIFNSGGETNE